MNDQIYSFGPWSWSVKLALEIIAAEPRDTIDIEVPGLKDGAWSVFGNRAVVNEQWALKNADLSKPLIVVNLAEDGHLVIDGWHRLRRAACEGLRTLPAYELTVAEEASIRKTV